MNFSYDPDFYRYPKSAYEFSRNIAYEENWKFLRCKKEEPEEYITIPKTEILLGAEDVEYESAVTVPHSYKRRSTWIIAGGQGLGKTVLKDSIVVDQLHFRFKHPLLYFDFKFDSMNLMYPNTNPTLIGIMEKYHKRPKAYNFLSVSPIYMNLEGRAKRTDNLITMSLHDFQNMDADVRIAIFKNLLEIKKEEPAYAIISQILSREKIPLTIADFKKAIKDTIENSEAKLKSERILWKIDELVNTKKLSDKYFNYAEAMKRHKMVVFEGTVADESITKDMMQGIFVNNAIYNLVNAKRDGKIREIPYVVTEEANTVGGKDGQSAGILTALSTKYREIRGKAGIGSIIITQFLHELAPKIVSEAEYIVCPKITNEKDIELIKNRGSDNYLFDDMHCDPKDPPSDWIIFGRNGLEDYQKFVPLPRASRMGST